MKVIQYDVAVAGSGSAGLTAAIVAASSGLRVVLVEKSAHFGGTSAWSGGGCWIPGNAMAAKLDIEDSIEEGDRYATAVVGNHLRRDLLDVFLANCNAMLDFMLKNSEVRFFPRTPAPDYHMEAPGARIGGRSLASPYYDGRLLGADMLDRLQLPLNSFNAPMGMMMSPLDFMHAMKMFRSWSSFRHMASVGGRYALDRLRYGRGTRLTMGNALVARLLKSAMNAGVTLWTETPALRLRRDSGRVSGLVVQHDGAELLIETTRGVVLATGGFAADPALRATHYLRADDHQSMVAPGNVGEGLRMAQEQGAVLGTGNNQPAAWGAVSVLEGNSGPTARCLHFFTDLPKPGNIVVGADGKRFANEANLQLAQAMLATSAVPAWMICDHRSLKKYGAGLIWPYAINLLPLQRAGYVVSAPTLQALAARIGIDGAALAVTVARYNAQAAIGIDSEFGRGNSPLDRSMGDPSHSPNPCLGPLETGPFHAIKLRLGDAGSVIGLKVDSQAHVLDAADRPIEGLYACGLDMNSIWAGAGIANGMNHAHNMTFAYIAGRALAAAQGAGRSET